ncbi:hypothetical protein C9374_005632 [Naegleria lovaniensis]|uniref:tRNA(Ile)-lysidine synthetase n=1 Tax=Naegleria lovaniensis TaxID=51637 RepID=A0AA88KK95_NAELO|nr:uncharacterized protein C9374_005632 [Naegleria lovaniensis]KAG2382430.1 hypothetical protein C9374_005632 [Naegleria lovaniensis]
MKKLLLRHPRVGSSSLLFSNIHHHHEALVVTQRRTLFSSSLMENTKNRGFVSTTCYSGSITNNTSLFSLLSLTMNETRHRGMKRRGYHTSRSLCEPQSEPQATQGVDLLLSESGEDNVLPSGSSGEGSESFEQMAEITLATYMQRNRHYRKFTEEEVQQMKRNLPNLMSPPSIISEFPFELARKSSTQPASPSNKSTVSPINTEEYFAVLDKIYARVEQRGVSVSKICVCVSGGGDSMGTAILVSKWRDHMKQKRGIDLELVAITVDHQIRPESEHEMLYVHEILSTQLKYNHVTCAKVIWSMDQKKQQRYARMKRQLIVSSECVSQKIDLVITGHHKQDNIETIIHRIAFASGISGLNGIPLIHAYRVAEANIVITRPGLVFDAQELKAVCMQHNIKWVEDPKNSAESEFRAIIRSRLGALYSSGIAPSNFYNLLLTVGTIRHIMARETLNFFNRYVRFDDEFGFAGIYFYSLEKTAEFIALNALNSLIQYVTNKDLPISLNSLKNVVRSLPSTKRSLGGTLLVPDKKVLYVIRDTGFLRRKKKHVPIHFHDNGVIWDNRFFIQLFQYNKMNTSEKNITYSKKLTLEKQPEYDNVFIPNFDGKVDTDPRAELRIRPFTEADHKYFLEHYPLMMRAAKQFPDYLTRSFPVIEDDKGILAIPFLGWKRCVNIYWLIKFLPSHSKFLMGEVDSLYDFVKLFSSKK